MHSLNKNCNILFFCSTNDFQNFTRRSTIEAIGRIVDSSLAVCITNFWNKKNSNFKSNSISVTPFYKYFPLVLLRTSFFANINQWLNSIFYGPLALSKYDYYVFTTPHQNFLLNSLKKGKIIFILSDPYHLMSYSKDDELYILERSDMILATSKALKTTYLKLYFSSLNIPSDKVYYWPNCVDLEVWDFNKKSTNQKNCLNNCSKVIGFAGNFMDVTDLQLLIYLIKKLPTCTFVLVGKINYKKGTEDFLRLNNIISYVNVDYKGYIPYNLLPSEVATWDICIMIDKITELASYHHHNKLYQYLSVGKPVVYQINHDDYRDLRGPLFGVKSGEEFVEKLQNIIESLDNGYCFFEQATRLAAENSSDVRALEFLQKLDF